MANDRKIKTIRWIITSHPLLASVLLTNGLTEMILELTKLSNIFRLRLNVSFTTLIIYFLVLALALILGTNGLMDSHLCWFKTSIDGCPFFLRFLRVILTW